MAVVLLRQVMEKEEGKEEGEQGGEGWGLPKAELIVVSL
jgi:hypothetical protein